MADRMQALLSHPRWPALPQAVVLALTLVAIGALFLGPEQGERNLGSFLLWHVWWAGLPVAALFLGRLWCALCPVSLLDAARGARGPFPLTWPAALGRNEGPLLAASVLLVHLINLRFALEDHAVASRAFIAAMIAAAVAVTLLARGRPWCRSLCPAGAFSGVLARAAPWRVAADPERCGRACAGATCRGEAGTGICPVGEDPRRSIDPGQCVLCGDCLRACPGVRPASGRLSSLPLSAAAPTLVLLGIVADAVLVQINDWPILFWRLCTALGIAPGAWQELGLHALVTTAPLLAATALVAATGRERFAERFALVAQIALPLAAAAALAVAARELLVTAPRHLGDLAAAAGHGGFALKAFSRLLDGQPIRVFQQSAVALGALASLRRVLPALRDPDRRATALAATLLLACAASLLAWEFSQALGP